jgi:hypothetical protein
MNCGECRELLVSYIEGLLDSQDKQLVETHLHECPECKAEFEDFVRLHKSLTSGRARLDYEKLESKVSDRILKEQALKLRKIAMLKTYTKRGLGFVAAAAVIIIVVGLMANVFHETIPTASATQVLQDAINAILDVQSVHMKAKMRTLPGDNFGLIGLNYDFVPIEMWKQTDANGLLQWRVEKPIRVLLMDGKTTTMLIRPNHGARTEKALQLGCYDSWMGRLLNVQDLLDSELQNAKNNPDREVHLNHQEIGGRDKLVLKIDITTSIAKDDYLRNKFLTESDHTKVYTFDAKTKLLEGLQVYVHTDKEDVLIFEIEDIEYNCDIKPDVFTLALPEDIIWYVQPQPLANNEKYASMTPEQVARAFFEACAAENWDEVLKFWNATAIDQGLKDYLGGIKIISIGTPFKSGGYGGWFVPYEIQFKNGGTKKMNLAVRNDNPAKRYVVDGGI